MMAISQLKKINKRREKMRSKFLLILLLIPCIIFTQETVKKDNRGYIQEKEYNFNAGSNDILKFDTRSSDIFISVGSNNKVNIKAVKRINFGRLESLWIDDFTDKDAAEEFQMREYKIEKKGNSILIEDYRENDRDNLVNIVYHVTVPKKINYDFYTSSGDIRFYNDISGNIDLKSSSGDFSARNIEGNLKYSLSSGDIDVGEITGEFDGTSSSGDVELHTVNGNIFAHASSGDFKIRKLKITKGKISTSSGDVRISEIDGDLSMKTSSGDIDIEKISGKFDGRCSSGDLKIEEVLSDIKLETSSGDVDVRNASGSVDITTSSGGVELGIENGKSDNRNKKIRVKARKGGITVFLPSDINADIDARIRISSRYDYDSYRIDSDFPLDFSDDRRYVRGEGKVNKGGIPVILEAYNSNIYIQKK
jgi:DUF4097 and DUF4098 domain-containing protein YvlB